LKKSIVLLEVLVSLILFSIIAIVSSQMVLTLGQKNTNDTFILENNLVLETTRLFLSKQNDFSKLRKIDTDLYFDGNLLLENISKFEVTNSSNIISVNICIYEESICQIWKIRK